MQIAWKPHKGPQTEALTRSEFEILYGGARGGGKTDAGLAWLTRPISNPRYRFLVIRRNSTDLSDWLDRARIFYRPLGGEIAGNPAVIRFPSGAIGRVGHLKDTNAYTNYIGHEYHRILVEELTLIPDEDSYLKLISSCRTTVEGLDPRVFATTNPGNAGHAWVKKRFVINGDKKAYQDPKTGRHRIYIKSLVTDNPTLMKNDPTYISYLKGLPEKLMRAWLYGDWDVFVGMYFDEFERTAHIYNPKDVKILDAWPRFRSIDWGYTAPTACYWHAIGPDSHLYTYREYYQTKKLDVIAAQEIAKLTQPNEKVEYTVGDPQSFPVEIPHYKYGKLESVKRSDVWAENGVPLIMGDSKRVPGWSRMREYLRVRSYRDGQSPWWHISSECTNLIDELTSAIYDDSKIEDIAADCQDHALESCRLGMMSRPPLFPMDKPKMTMLEAAERQMKRQEQEAQDW